MDLRYAIAAALMLCGCAQQQQIVRWNAVPEANVPWQVDQVAVVAVDRDCGPLADRLARQLDAQHGVQVNPSAAVRLHMYECGVHEATVLHEESTASEQRRRLAVETRAHAVVAVIAGGSQAMQLIGAHHATAHSPWGDVDLHQTRERSHRDAYEGVARDLATQLAPVPTQITRRLYRDASTGSPEDFHNQAVAAERIGNLDEAVRLAELAADLAPAEEAHKAYLHSVRLRAR